MCETVEIEHKGVKWVDASGMAVRVRAEKAVRAAVAGADGNCRAQKRRVS